MIVFPNLEKTERPINQHRNHRQEKPNPRKRFGFLNWAQKRIQNKTAKQPEINAETSGANCKRLISEKKGASRNLMTNVTAKFINQTRNARQIVCFGNRGNHNHKNPNSR